MKDSTFAKTICSICYEDLKPIVEDLQSISICGHVFHELCIQQWFGYCSKGKKPSCPVCKQNCSEDSVSRLYFQSVGDSSLTQKPTGFDENPVELQIEVERLTRKVVGLSQALESQQKDAKELSEELCLTKELVKKETATKNEALRQKASIQQSLRSILEELDKSNVECTRLQERNMALAKELAALKLASDLNLEEEDILKLASLGNEASNKDKIDVLKKTLVLRNKSYKELMAKCNTMGRGEARCLRKLQKKKEKIRKLKSRVQELEKASEEKENEVLRGLKKSSKRARCEEDKDIDVGCNFNSSFVNKFSSSSVFKAIHMEESGSAGNTLYSPSKPKNFIASNGIATPDPKCDTIPIALDKEIGCNMIIDENESNISGVIDGISKPFTRSHISEGIFEPEKSTPIPEAAPSRRSENIAYVDLDKDDSVNTNSENADDDEVLIIDNIKQVDSFPCTKKETPPVAQPGDVCFSGGLLAPNGTLRHLGKWCKRANNNGPSAQGSSTNSGNLIAVGADGRGGKVKILRPSQLSEIRETTPLMKKSKLGAKTTTLQSRGIEHFFGKAGR